MSRCCHCVTGRLGGERASAAASTSCPQGPSASAYTAEWTQSLSGGCISPRSYRQGRRPVAKPRRCAPGYCTRLTRNAIRAPEPPSANSSTDCFYAIWTDAPTRMKLAAAESSVSIQVRPIDVVRAVTQTVTRGDDQLDGTGRCREASGSGPLPRHAVRNPDWAIC
jgi:hypothetical protein